MQRALELAKLGLGKVSPNPMVGCVIVCNGRVIGEGYHQQYGGPHAEVQAINSVADREKLKNASLFVTLEPCSHFGKTPPCADLIIQYKIPEVYIAVKDPNPKVAGKGVKKLQAAGVRVYMGTMETAAKELNKRFFTAFVKQRPYIILKWAETANGFIARENYDSKWISSSYSRTLVHKWRAEEDAILVGTNTALYDNPQLNVRDWKGENPVRIAIDRNLRLPADLHIFDGKDETLLFYNEGVEATLKHHQDFGIPLKETLFIEELLLVLYKRKIQSVIVEGGTKIIEALLEKGMWDEARVFKAKTVFEKGIVAPKIHGTLKNIYQIADDNLFLYVRA